MRSLIELGGTFLPNADGIEPGVYASTAYTPEVAEEEDRLREPTGFVPIEEIADPNWHHPLEGLM